GVGDVDVEVVQRPDVAAAVVRRCGARLADLVRRAVDDLVAAREEEPARRAAEAGGHAAQVAAVDVHGVDLVALALARPRRLEDQALAVRGEVRLGVLAGVRQHAQVREPWLVRAAREGYGADGGWCIRHGAAAGRRCRGGTRLARRAARGQRRGGQGGNRRTYTSRHHDISGSLPAAAIGGRVDGSLRLSPRAWRRSWRR